MIQGSKRLGRRILYLQIYSKISLNASPWCKKKVAIKGSLHLWEGVLYHKSLFGTQDKVAFKGNMH